MNLVQCDFKDLAQVACRLRAAARRWSLEQLRSGVRPADELASHNGRTADSDSASLGSNPSPPAHRNRCYQVTRQSAAAVSEPRSATARLASPPEYPPPHARFRWRHVLSDPFEDAFSYGP